MTNELKNSKCHLENRISLAVTSENIINQFTDKELEFFT